MKNGAGPEETSENEGGLRCREKKNGLGAAKCSRVKKEKSKK